MRTLCECNSYLCRETIEIPLEVVCRLKSLKGIAILSKKCATPVTEEILEDQDDFLVVRDEIQG